MCASHHQPPHSLLLDTLILLLLLSLSVGVVRGYGFGHLLDLCGDGTVKFLEVLCMLQDAVEILLQTQNRTGGSVTNNLLSFLNQF